MLLQNDAIVTIYTPRVKMDDDFTKFKYLNMQVNESRSIFADSAQEAGHGARLPPFSVVAFIHTVLEDFGFEVHVFGKSEHTTGSYVHSQMQLA